MADTTKQLIDPRNPLDRLDARVGMHLAFWAYPQPDIHKANEIALMTSSRVPCLRSAWPNYE
ncbi:MAG: hypothetical protein CVU29_11260 [Betaproteobacteria bacterium HGW-Betaproteobacteria-22]|nr:MAG: hypothetical protein CVU29_11260 [Betaproteobacteria bacterium HGW-Betaproteobacteria-22]